MTFRGSRRLLLSGSEGGGEKTRKYGECVLKRGKKLRHLDCFYNKT